MDSTTVPEVRRRIRRNPEQWHELLDRFEHSGQTREQFCAEQGLGLSTFGRWRQRLREGRASSSVRADNALFVELAPQAPSPCASHWDVELQLGTGVYLRLKRIGC
jgi:hypothetical protein